MRYYHSHHFNVFDPNVLLFDQPGVVEWKRTYFANYKRLQFTEAIQVNMVSRVNDPSYITASGDGAFHTEGWLFARTELQVIGSTLYHGNKILKGPTVLWRLSEGSRWPMQCDIICYAFLEYNETWCHLEPRESPHNHSFRTATKLVCLQCRGGTQSNSTLPSCSDTYASDLSSSKGSTGGMIAIRLIEGNNWESHMSTYKAAKRHRRIWE